MLVGRSTIRSQQFSLPISNQYYSICAVGLVGATTPPAGTGGLFAYMSDNAWTGSGVDSIGLLEYNVNFSSPQSSTLLSSHYAVSAFNPSVRSISQPKGQKLDALANFVMNQPTYRSFGSSESLAFAFTVIDQY